MTLVVPTKAEIRKFDAEEKATIRRGAKLLDKMRPSWFKSVSIQKLDLGSCDLCVLGQLYDNGTKNGYDRGLDLLKEKLDSPEYAFIISDEYGFSSSEECADEMWAYEIARRRAAERAKKAAAAKA